MKLRKGQLFAHYAIVPFLLIAPVFTTYSLFQIYVSKTYTGMRTAEELMIVGYPWLILALFFYFYQRQKLFFREIDITVDKNQFYAATELAAISLGWIIKSRSPKIIKATRSGNFLSGSWGEMVTIIREDDKVLVNSICDPNGIISVASYGWNKKNMKIFEQYIESQ